jgi:hypothetical protein
MNKNRIKSDDLIDIKSAKDLFGKGWSTSSITRRINNGELKEGKHYINDASVNSKQRKIKLIISGIEKFRGTLSYQR